MAIDLQAFCDEECQPRYARKDSLNLTRPFEIELQFPWASGTYAAATDAAIIVVSKQPLPWFPPGPFPKVHVALADFPQDRPRKWRKLPEPRRCAECNGLGVLKHTCESWYCRRTHYGRTCDKCQLSIGKKRLSQWYANKIRSLPDAAIWSDDADPCSPIWFRFIGGFGAVMPTA